jgi:hypothetical protein
LPLTLRHVTGPPNKAPQVTCPVGFSPLGPLRALMATRPSPPQLLATPLPVTESCSGRGGWGAAIEIDGIASSPAARTPSSIPMRVAVRLMTRTTHLHLVTDETG